MEGDVVATEGPLSGPQGGVGEPRGRGTPGSGVVVRYDESRRGRRGGGRRRRRNEHGLGFVTRLVGKICLKFKIYKI